MNVPTEGASPLRNYLSLHGLSAISAEEIEASVLDNIKRAVVMGALSAEPASGQGMRKFADFRATEAERTVLDGLFLPAEVVIGECAKDEAPGFNQGERLGPHPDHEALIYLAIDPLEATESAATNRPGAICVIAAAVKGEGSLMGGVDGYADKIVIANDLALALYDGEDPLLSPGQTLLEHPIEEVVQWIARRRDKPLTKVSAMILDREYNAELISRLRALRVSIRLITDGDITAAMLAMDPEHDVDIAPGKGAAAEAIIAAAMARAYKGHMECRWHFPDNEKGRTAKTRMLAQGVEINRVFCAEDMASGHVMFALTAVTANDLVPGVKYAHGMAITHSISGRSRTHTIAVTKQYHPNPPAPPAAHEWPEDDNQYRVVYG